EQLAQGDWQSFLDNKQQLDSFIADKAKQASEQGKVLRYTGALSLADNKVTAQVGLAFATQGDALANLTPGDNIFVINSQLYSDNAL
ncbi:hypothetical protein ACJBUF_10410, partial [Streptococcus suis]